MRLFDESKDEISDLVNLWNEYYGTTLFSVDQFQRLEPRNVVVVETEEGIVGFAILLDGGMPYAVLDQLYIRPRYRRFATLRDVFKFVEQQCKDRGIGWFYGLLDQAGGESEQFCQLLKRRAAWNAEYMGEKPMFVKHVL